MKETKMSGWDVFDTTMNVVMKAGSYVIVLGVIAAFLYLVVPGFVIGLPGAIEGIKSLFAYIFGWIM